MRELNDRVIHGQCSHTGNCGEQAGGAFEQSSVKSSMSDRKGWDGSRQRFSRSTTAISASIQTSCQPCDTTPAQRTESKCSDTVVWNVSLVQLSASLKPRESSRSTNTAASSKRLPFTLSFVRVTSTTMTPTLNTADPRRKPHQKLKLPRPSSRM